MGGGGLSRLFVRSFLSHSAEKIVAESFSVSFFLGIENFFRTERFVMIFWSKFFCLTVTKNFVGGREPICV